MQCARTRTSSATADAQSRQTESIACAQPRLSNRRSRRSSLRSQFVRSRAHEPAESESRQDRADAIRRAVSPSVSSCIRRTCSTVTCAQSRKPESLRHANRFHAHHGITPRAIGPVEAKHKTKSRRRLKLVNAAAQHNTVGLQETLRARQRPANSHSEAIPACPAARAPPIQTIRAVDSTGGRRIALPSVGIRRQLQNQGTSRRAPASRAQSIPAQSPR